MKKRVSLSDPEWSETFPSLIEPGPDEWLPGLLLRCDLSNHWESRTTLRHLIRTTQGKWLSPKPTLIVAPLWLLESLAKLLLLPMESLLATTYQLELMRLYAPAAPNWKQLNDTSEFRVCPECVAQHQLLTRVLMLPHISACPQHHMLLQSICQCGHHLSAFSQNVPPFACEHCYMSWAQLPLLPVTEERLIREQKVLAWFTFYFTNGTPELIARALHLIRSTMRKKKSNIIIGLDGTPRYVESYHIQSISISLGSLINLLMSFEFSIEDILNYSEALPWWSL